MRHIKQIRAITSPSPPTHSWSSSPILVRWLVRCLMPRGRRLQSGRVVSRGWILALLIVLLLLRRLLLLLTSLVILGLLVVVEVVGVHGGCLRRPGRMVARVRRHGGTACAARGEVLCLGWHVILRHAVLRLGPEIPEDYAKQAEDEDGSDDCTCDPSVVGRRTPLIDRGGRTALRLRLWRPGGRRGEAGEAGDGRRRNCAVKRALAT
jgi:hypothetical protein